MAEGSFRRSTTFFFVLPLVIPPVNPCAWAIGVIRQATAKKESKTRARRHLDITEAFLIRTQDEWQATEGGNRPPRGLKVGKVAR